MGAFLHDWEGYVMGNYPEIPIRIRRNEFLSDPEAMARWEKDKCRTTWLLSDYVTKFMRDGLSYICVSEYCNDRQKFNLPDIFYQLSPPLQLRVLNVDRRRLIRRFRRKEVGEPTPEEKAGDYRIFHDFVFDKAIRRNLQDPSIE